MTFNNQNIVKLNIGSKVETERAVLVAVKEPPTDRVCLIPSVVPNEFAPLTLPLTSHRDTVLVITQWYIAGTSIRKK